MSLILHPLNPKLTCLKNPKEFYPFTLACRLCLLFCICPRVFSYFVVYISLWNNIYESRKYKGLLCTVSTASADVNTRSILLHLDTHQLPDLTHTIFVYYGPFKSFLKNDFQIIFLIQISNFTDYRTKNVNASHNPTLHVRSLG